MYATSVLNFLHQLPVNLMNWQIIKSQGKRLLAGLKMLVDIPVFPLQNFSFQRETKSQVCLMYTKEHILIGVRWDTSVYTVYLSEESKFNIFACYGKTCVRRKISQRLSSQCFKKRYASWRQQCDGVENDLICRNWPFHPHTWQYQFWDLQMPSSTACGTKIT